jgi:hypothetical protein
MGKRIREALDRAGDPAGQIRAARDGLLDRVAARNGGDVGFAGRPARGIRPWARSWRRALLATSVAALAATAVVVWLRLPAISFWVGSAGAPGHIGDVVEATGPDLVPVRFSEGSSVVLQSGGRVRVLAADPAGARVLVESGSVDVSIVPRKRQGTRWSFEAGPYKVVVTGTKFRVGWNPKDQAFALHTTEGSVVVTGPCLSAPRTVPRGDRLRLSCPSPASVPATPVGPTALATPAAGRGSSDRPSVPPPTGRGLASAAGRGPAGADWRELIAAGRFDEGLRAAERADFGRVCRTASDKELLALADAARLSGHSVRAVFALGILRQRFPRTPGAATAAFALGRIAYEQRGSYREAVRWFRIYLDEQPNGPLMGDAVGRLMEARHRAGDRAGARADAERYLARFSEGPYAGAARAILAE